MGSKRKEKMSTEEQVDHIHIHRSLFGQSRENSNCCDSDSNSHHRAKRNKNQNSNITNSCKVILNPLLLEDLRIHIFTFVPLNNLLNSIRYVCKPWAETIGSSHFAQLCERIHGHSKLGLYVEDYVTKDKSYFLEFKDRVNGHFERTNLGTPQRMGLIVGACDGMLLLRNCISKQNFFVNPLLKCWLSLPDYPISPQCKICTYHVNITRIPRTTNFKLFFANNFFEVSGVYWYVLYVLRIGIDNSWKEIIRKEASLQQPFVCKTFYGGGNDIYWITKEVVFVIDIVKEIILREYPLPYVTNIMSPRYLLMEDRISYIASNDFLTFQIYILNFDSGELFLHHEMGPFDFVGTCGRAVYKVTMIFSLWINDQIIFKVTLRRNKEETSCLVDKHFSYNMKTRQLTEIEDIAVGRFNVWLHTNSLISLPNTPI